MLDDDTIATEQQLQDEEWLRNEMEDHAVEFKVHALRLVTYKDHLAKLIGVEPAQSFLEELKKW